MPVQCTTNSTIQQLCYLSCISSEMGMYCKLFCQIFFNAMVKWLVCERT